MKDTHEYVEKLQENQRKQEKNHKQFGKGHPDKRLPNERNN
ncbi:MAG: DUF4023 family protein [Bacillus sp. (in: firmicutes)]